MRVAEPGDSVVDPLVIKHIKVDVEGLRLQSCQPHREEDSVPSARLLKVNRKGCSEASAPFPLAASFTFTQAKTYPFLRYDPMTSSAASAQAKAVVAQPFRRAHRLIFPDHGDIVASDVLTREDLDGCFGCESRGFRFSGLDTPSVLTERAASRAWT